VRARAAAFGVQATLAAPPSNDKSTARVDRIGGWHRERAALALARVSALAPLRDGQPGAWRQLSAFAGVTYVLVLMAVNLIGCEGGGGIGGLRRRRIVAVPRRTSWPSASSHARVGGCSDERRAG